MSLPTYLSNIKSSGIYRFVWDKSEIPGAQDETLRLVVGYSEKGPFNTPVYVKDEEEFKLIYGGISKKLERYGIWFHRMAIQALQRGPILALNLKPFSTETVSGVSFNPQECVVAIDDETMQPIYEAINLTVSEIYNTHRFWVLEPEQFEDNPKTQDQYISIFATDSKETSNTIFVRGYQPTGYDVTVKEWYSSVLNGEDIPPYLNGHENDYISQYWAEIYVFKGEFTPSIATSDKLAKFFDINNGKVTLKPYIVNAFGEKLDTLEQLSKNDASNFVKSYAGILLPEFLSATNTVLSLDAQFNSDHNAHKMIMRLNQALLYNGDIDVSELDTTGWTAAFKENADQTPVMSFTGLNPQVSKAEFNEDTNTWEFSDPINPGTSVDFFDYGIAPTETDNDYAISVPSAMGLAGIVTGDKFLYKVAGKDEYVVTSLVKIETKAIESDTESDAYTYIYTFDNPVANADWTLDGQASFVKCVNSVTATSANMFPTYLEGYTYTHNKPESTKQFDKLQWQHDILDTLSKYKGIRIALTDRVSVDYRYLVDTFEGFVESECKSRLSIICKEKDNAFGLLNLPSMKNFARCDYTSFTDANGMFDTKFIPMGGNPQKSMGMVFTLASEENGASFVSYNSCLHMKDVNTGIEFDCPPAALVSNLYMNKYTKYFPYTIIAGPKRSVIKTPGLIGPDFNFGRYDLDNLEPFGINCMVYVPRQGTYINSNQTAKQNPVTTLSKINVRELCIFLQDEIAKLLQFYHWDLNTPNLQSTIKDRADVILETAKNNGGVYKYLNVCDDSNNTDDVINNEFFVLSTAIEPGMGAGKMVHNLTIYRKGGMSSSIITY